MIASLKDAFDAAEHGVYDCTINGKCSCCGDCCGNRLPMNQEEINTIQKYIKKHIIKPTIRVLKCKIYPLRPQICREFICNVGKRFVPSLAVLDGEHHNINVRETFF